MAAVRLTTDKSGKPGSPARCTLMGLQIDRLTKDEAIERILAACEQGEGGSVVTPNVDILRQVQEDEGTRHVVEKATLRLADGAPLVWASQLQREALPERIPGASFIWWLSAAAARAGLPIFLLGAAPGVAAKAGQKLEADIPGLLVAGAHCPPLGFEHSREAMGAIIDSISAANPRIVFCGLGCPKQERLMARLAEIFPHIWFLASGGSLDFIAGVTTRAPDWMQNAGLEWLHRLTHEPKRLFRRYVVDDVPFALRLLARSATVRWRLQDPGRRPPRSSDPDPDKGIET
jgi:N-acetylglucosaminyldiphosphoundecaprenol N-acetyl-beta-D-mannosaminyltransferase